MNFGLKKYTSTFTVEKLYVCMYILNTKFRIFTAISLQE